MMAGVGKKPALMATREFSHAMDLVSKAALIDALWCACQRGTNESNEQILSQAARNVAIALDHRGDVTPKTIKTAAAVAIDSD